MQRWRPSPLLVASAALHLALPALLAWRPAHWPWLLAALLADHAVIAAAGLWPRRALLGANLTRLPAAAAARGEVALTIDDGPDPDVTPQLLELLAGQGARATFFCIGARAAEQPQLCAAIRAGGHALENHSQNHRLDFSLLGPRRMAREIDSAQRTLEALGGRAPTLFRAPAGLRNPWLDPLLRRRGLRLATWTRRGFDTRERDPQRVLRRLCRDLRAGDILLLHDGHAARTADGRAVSVAVLPELLAALRAAGLRSVPLPQALESVD